MKASLHAQKSAVDVMATQARQRGNLKMKAADWEMLEPRLSAAVNTLQMLEIWRERLVDLAPGFISEIESDR